MNEWKKIEQNSNEVVNELCFKIKTVNGSEQNRTRIVIKLSQYRDNSIFYCDNILNYCLKCTNRNKNAHTHMSPSSYKIIILFTNETNHSPRR